MILKHFLFACLEVKGDSFYIKQLDNILKQEYGTPSKDYDKTSSSISFDNSYVKTIIFNMIMDIILHTYTASVDNNRI